MPVLITLTLTSEVPNDDPGQVPPGADFGNVDSNCPGSGLAEAGGGWLAPSPDGTVLVETESGNIALIASPSGVVSAETNERLSRSEATERYKASSGDSV